MVLDTCECMKQLSLDFSNSRYTFGDQFLETFTETRNTQLELIHLDFCGTVTTFSDKGFITFANGIQRFKCLRSLSIVKRNIASWNCSILSSATMTYFFSCLGHLPEIVDLKIDFDHSCELTENSFDTLVQSMKRMRNMKKFDCKCGHRNYPMTEKMLYKLLHSLQKIEYITYFSFHYYNWREGQVNPELFGKLFKRKANLREFQCYLPKQVDLNNLKIKLLLENKQLEVLQF